MEVMEKAGELVRQGKVGSAIDLLEQAVANGEESGELCKQIARLCHSVNEMRAFANWCHEAMRIDPSDGEPHLMMARELHRMGRWDEAEEALEHALRMTSLSTDQRAEAEMLLDRASTASARRRAANPGYSNL